MEVAWRFSLTIAAGLAGLGCNQTQEQGEAQRESAAAPEPIGAAEPNTNAPAPEGPNLPVPGRPKPRTSGAGKSSRLRMGAVAVNGRLPKDVVERVVRSNQPAFEACYERARAADPLLQGRVTVRFLIDRNGSVTSASDGGSNVNNPALVRCVLRAFHGLNFPKPEGGAVTVVYPLMFSGL